jgi:Flp pilus assembly protein TadD
MKKIFSVATAGAIALLATGTAAAQQSEVGYPAGSLGVQAIMSSDYATAERQLRDTRVARGDPGRLINLGVVLARTGRSAAATKAFERVLDEENVELILANGNSMYSHEIARAALRGLNRER